MKTIHVAVVVSLWLAAAIAVGAAGIPARLKPPGPQLVLAGLTVALILAGVFVRPFHRWVASVDLRILVGFHLTRFVGFYFLYLYQRGELPYAFAVPGGIGDVIVAAAALGLLLTTLPTTRIGKSLYLGWNVLGLIDILGVVATAAAQSLKDAESMQALTTLPLCLLITFLVPQIIASHVFLVVRLSSQRPFKGEP